MIRDAEHDALTPDLGRKGFIHACEQGLNRFISNDYNVII